MPTKPMVRKGPYEFGIETPVRNTSGCVVTVDIAAGTFIVEILDEKGQPYVDRHELQFDDIYDGMRSAQRDQEAAG